MGKQYLDKKVFGKVATEPFPNSKQRLYTWTFMVGAMDPAFFWGELVWIQEMYTPEI